MYPVLEEKPLIGQENVTIFERISVSIVTATFAGFGKVEKTLLLAAPKKEGLSIKHLRKDRFAIRPWEPAAYRNVL